MSGVSNPMTADNPKPSAERCTGETREGWACKMPALPGQERCHFHGGERERRYTESESAELWAERLEEAADEMLSSAISEDRGKGVCLQWAARYIREMAKEGR